MFFRNLTMFRFPATLDLADLEAMLSECAAKPVGPLELSSRGFLTPFGQHGSAFTAKVGNATWLTVGGEDKLLPGAVVNGMLAKKLAEIEEKEGRKPGGRERKRIKDDLVTQLLPRAFTRPVRSDALIDTDAGLIVIDTSSRKRGEEVVSEVRRALGSFPALPLNAEVSPRAILTGWVAGDALPDGLALGGECELRDPADKGKVKISDMELEGDEVAKHLEAGKQCTRLALVLDDRISFVIGEDLIVRKFKLLDGATEALESTERDDIAAELEARFALMAGETSRLFKVLEGAFRLTAAD